MLSSLSIKNYRNLKDLQIDSLGRVNLIAGKNNTGKTSLLEAVSLYAYKGSLHWVDSLLRRRGEFYSSLENSLENNQKSYASLFYKREVKPYGNNRLLIGPKENVEYPNDEKFLQNTLNIRFAILHKTESVLKDEATNETLTRTLWKVLEDEEMEEGLTLRIGLKVMFDKKGGAYKLDELDRQNDIIYFINKSNSPVNIQFVRTSNTDEEIAQAWDRIASTDKEKYLVDALMLIEKDIKSLDFIKDESSHNERRAVVRIRDNRLPLKSMGDGMNRILTIILALTNSENGYLLIDEFENGLHYTVQEDLWRMIFKLANELNVQVFATTHSNDCIRAFENVLNSEGNQDKGQFLRLDKIKEEIIATLYTPSELKTATEHFIEVR